VNQLTAIAHCIDIVEPARIEALLSKHPHRAAQRLFTPDELAYANSQPARRSEHLAARFAAKEAVFKALGTGWTQGIAWTDIQVVRAPSGAPSLKLSGRAETCAKELGIEHWLISLTHVKTLAMASVIGVGKIQSK